MIVNYKDCILPQLTIESIHYITFPVFSQITFLE